MTGVFSTLRNLIVIRICRAYFLITPDQYHLPCTFPDGLPADTGFPLKELIADFVEFFGVQERMLLDVSRRTDLSSRARD
ncbi:MAG: hypothetical protein PHF57_08215 [Methanoregula sp.]|jgi:hypothetical protein|nr:hypothetical protein [Methanoregula sp.]MDD5188178.1 hypothetical protein [Methanoregula sp.]